MKGLSGLGIYRLGIVGLVAAVLGGTAAAPVEGAPAAAQSRSAELIYAGWFGNTIPTPAFIRNNKAFLETQPFHGIVAYLRNDSTGSNATSRVMTNTPISESAIAAIVAPMAGQTWTTLRKNFGLVQGSSPPDVFDDWSVVVQNFKNCAAALKAAIGRSGLFLEGRLAAMPGAPPTDLKAALLVLQHALVAGGMIAGGRPPKVPVPPPSRGSAVVGQAPRAAGVRTERNPQFPDTSNAFPPEGGKVEILNNASTSPGVQADG